MRTVLITGGTGLIGKRLTEHLLEKGYKVIILTRSVDERTGKDNLGYASWNIYQQAIDIQAVQSADTIIHLAGAGVVDKRWTAAYKKDILESRVLGSKLLVDTLNQYPNKVKTIVSASAIGWYGPDIQPGRYFIESDKASKDFLGQICVAWEQSISVASSMNIRVCKFRAGIVLSNEGGALTEFKKPVRFGVAAILGSGKQIISWIHIDDLCRMYIYAMENNNINGSYNAVASQPVSNKEFTLTLAKKLKGRFFLPIHIPAFVLKLILGESSIEVLKSTAVSNEKIKESGFNFLYPSIGSAIAKLTGGKL